MQINLPLPSMQVFLWCPRCVSRLVHMGLQVKAQVTNVRSIIVCFRRQEHQGPVLLSNEREREHLHGSKFNIVIWCHLHPKTAQPIVLPNLMYVIYIYILYTYAHTGRLWWRLNSLGQWEPLNLQFWRVFLRFLNDQDKKAHLKGNPRGLRLSLIHIWRCRRS